MMATASISKYLLIVGLILTYLAPMHFGYSGIQYEVEGRDSVDDLAVSRVILIDESLPMQIFAHPDVAQYTDNEAKGARALLTNGEVTTTATSIPIQKCASNGLSQCVVKAGSPVNCACNLNVFFFKNCDVSQPLNITLDTNSFFSQTSEHHLIPYKVVGERTMELALLEAEANVYHILCSNSDDKWNLVPSHLVHVGYPPIDVVNFRCVSYNWEELICRWDLPFNPAQGTQKYRPYLNPKTECDWGRDCQYGSLTEINCCYWDSKTEYEPQNPNLAMVFMVKDVFTGKDSQFIHPIDYLGIVLPDPAQGLSTEVSGNDTALKLSWSTPSALVEFPGDLIYRIDYRINSSLCTDYYCTWQLAATGRCRSANCNAELEVSYPGLEYEIGVRLRSGASNFTLEDDGYWSNAANHSVAIPPQRPWVSPAMSTASFQVKENAFDSNRRDVIVSWRPLHFTKFNGPKLRYFIRNAAFGGPGEERTEPSTGTFTTFANRSRNINYTFEVRGVNSVGESNMASELHIPASANMPSLSVLPAAVFHSDLGIYELRWQGKAGLSHTIFLCVDDVRSRDPCQGNLYWMIADEVTSINVTARDFNVTNIAGVTSLRFAISSETENGVSSGMNWACCSEPQYFRNSPPGPPNIKEFTEVKSTSSVIRWETHCTDWGSILEGVSVEYCQGEHETVTACNAAVRQYTGPLNTSATDCLSEVLLSGLSPDSRYSVWVTFLSRGGPSHRSRSRSFATLASNNTSSLLLWQILLLSAGCLAAVVVILVVGSLSVRKVLVIKKQIDIQPQVPAAIKNNLGNLRKNPKEKDIITRPIPDLGPSLKNERRRSTSFLDPDLKIDSGSAISSIIQDTVRECFKPAEKTPAEEALMVSGGSINDMPICPSLKMASSLRSSSRSEIPESQELHNGSDIPVGKDSSSILIPSLNDGGTNGYVSYPGNVTVGKYLPIPNHQEKLSESLPTNSATSNGYLSLDIFGTQVVRQHESTHKETKDSNPVTKTRYVSLEDSGKWLSDIKSPVKRSDLLSNSGYVSVEDANTLSKGLDALMTPGHVTGYVTLKDLRNILPSAEFTPVESKEVSKKPHLKEQMMFEERILSPGYCRVDMEFSSTS